MTKQVEKNFGSIEHIQKQKDLPTKDLFVPEWNCWVQIQAVSNEEYMTAVMAAMEGDSLNTKRMQIAMVIESMRKPRLDLNAHGWLPKKSAGVVSRLFNDIQALSGLLTEEEKEAASKGGLIEGEDPTSGQPKGD